MSLYDGRERRNERCRGDAQSPEVDDDTHIAPIALEEEPKHSTRAGRLLPQTRNSHAYLHGRARRRQILERCSSTSRRASKVTRFSGVDEELHHPLDVNIHLDILVARSPPTNSHHHRLTGSIPELISRDTEPPPCGAIFSTCGQRRDFHVKTNPSTGPQGSRGTISVSLGTPIPLKKAHSRKQIRASPNAHTTHHDIVETRHEDGELQTHSRALRGLNVSARHILQNWLGHTRVYLSHPMSTTARRDARERQRERDC